MSTTISCNLTENALDYLVLAGEQAGEYTPRMLKHSLATLADGIELLLKARLEMTDWRLLFPKPEKVTLEQYQKGEAFTIGLDPAIERLGTHCSVYFSAKEEQLLQHLKKLRNKVRHFAITVERNAVISVIGRTYKLAHEFVHKHIAGANAGDARLVELANRFDAFIQQRMSEVQPEIDANRSTAHVDCPTCLQPALYADGDETRCRFCDERLPGEDAASLWADEFLGFRSIKDEMIDPTVEECDECGSTALVRISEATGGEIDYLCFCCGEHGDCQRCSECNRLYFQGVPRGDTDDFDEESWYGPDICPDCWDNKMGGDD